MDGYDIQKWRMIERKMVANKLDIVIKGESFLLSTKGKFFGAFKNSDELFSFICGYEAGKEGEK